MGQHRLVAGFFDELAKTAKQRTLKSFSRSARRAAKAGVSDRASEGSLLRQIMSHGIQRGVMTDIPKGTLTESGVPLKSDSPLSSHAPGSRAFVTSGGFWPLQYKPEYEHISLGDIGKMRGRFTLDPIAAVMPANQHGVSMVFRGKIPRNIVKPGSGTPMGAHVPMKHSWIEPGRQDVSSVEDIVRREVSRPDAPNVFRKMLEKKALQKLGVKIRLVDGGEVKVKHKMDFCEGGSDQSYPEFIPKGEVWVDKHLDASQRPYVAIHELVERARMAKGESYEKAHPKANKVEKVVRLEKRGSLPLAYHYARSGGLPANMLNLPPLERKQILKWYEEHSYDKNAKRYLRDRIALEKALKTIAEKKLGKVEMEHPLYFQLGKAKVKDRFDETGASEYKIHPDLLARSTFSPGDSFDFLRMLERTRPLRKGEKHAPIKGPPDPKQLLREVEAGLMSKEELERKGVKNVPIWERPHGNYIEGQVWAPYAVKGKQIVPLEKKDSNVLYQAHAFCV